jgi:hypothetical protein
LQAKERSYSSRRFDAIGKSCQEKPGSRPRILRPPDTPGSPVSVGERRGCGRIVSCDSPKTGGFFMFAEWQADSGNI